MNKSVITLEDFVEAQGLPLTAVQDLVEVLQEQERFELAKLNMGLNGRVNVSPGGRAEALPLTDDGDEWGRVEARIPKALFFNLMQQRTAGGGERLGYEGLLSDDGMKDVLRDFPQCRVETVSGKIVSGYTGPVRRIVKSYPENIKK